ncbi:RlpA-like double-psi beta-barrel-protein domain-containing protein-containing protein [Lentinula aciculospora]|uniref:RlpA-like double-psi beta-barrel-protein domain-containing protein-containing protein n=1 Tax=Lentinula aciculospora TaxID=153920 RepID=A0A9W9AQW7_9AGAR|nr:RlpA-like double-psi beta-barrel-protein domain-containing protein-containing protein [Lentinula aciculospora]
MPKFSHRSLFCILLSLCAFYLVKASHDFDPFLHRRHTSNAKLAKREAASFRRETSLEKRFDNSRFTYYEDGLGACGQTNKPSDFIVALNSAQFNGGQYCFQMITISIGGKSAQAQIMDECPGCPYGGLDFSEGLFEFFGSLDLGVLTGSWNFDSGASSTSQTPTSTYTPPTSTWSPAPSTSSKSTKTSSSTSTWSSSSTSLSSTSSFRSTSTTLSSSSSSSGSNTATSTASATPTVITSSGVLGMIEEAVMHMGLVAAMGAAVTPTA